MKEQSLNVLHGAIIPPTPPHTPATVIIITPTCATCPIVPAPVPFLVLCFVLRRTKLRLLYILTTFFWSIPSVFKVIFHFGFVNCCVPMTWSVLKWLCVRICSNLNVLITFLPVAYRSWGTICSSCLKLLDFGFLCVGWHFLRQSKRMGLCVRPWVPRLSASLHTANKEQQ